LIGDGANRLIDHRRTSGSSAFDEHAIGPLVSIGSHHRLEGLLMTSARGLVLSLENGGVWALDTDADAKKLLGQRVIVEGVRSGFDRIDVAWMGPSEAASSQTA
jgi:Protein of unknown function (DUF5818)